MDETDLKILRCLQDFPQSSVADIAKRIGLSHTPCWRRIRQLEESGVIQAYAVVLNAQAMGFDICVLALVNVGHSDEKTFEAFENAARDSPHVVECAAITGNTDYVLKVVMRSVADYETFLRKELMKFPGVKEIHSQFVLKQVKDTTRLPI
jgi:Lrp/AsnC family transcriptional regulator